jgi:hypothetical protein
VPRDPDNLRADYIIAAGDLVVGAEYNLGKTKLIIWRHDDDELTVEVFPNPIPSSALDSWSRAGLDRVEASFHHEKGE